MSLAVTVEMAFQLRPNHFLVFLKIVSEKLDKMSFSMTDVRGVVPHSMTGTFLATIIVAYLSRLIFQ